MIRAALYARYSSDQQNAASIADQLRLCREYAEREGWQIVATYEDAAISGSSMILRPGVQRLLADAQAGKFDIVVAEALDRVSRDQADVAILYKHLQFARVPLVTLAEGEISELHVGLKGTMNALFLKDLAKKTHRGLRGRVEKGFSAGAVGYGYRMVRRLSSEGELVRGEREVDPAQALIVERIFRETKVLSIGGRATEILKKRGEQPRFKQNRLIFLAADSHHARLVFNAVCHQYLIPGIQLGTRIDVESRTGTVTDIRSNVRLVLPSTGCLRCSRLISGARRQDESRGDRDRARIGARLAHRGRTVVARGADDGHAGDARVGDGGRQILRRRGVRQRERGKACRRQQGRGALHLKAAPCRTPRRLKMAAAGQKPVKLAWIMLSPAKAASPIHQGWTNQASSTLVSTTRPAKRKTARSRFMGLPFVRSGVF